MGLERQSVSALRARWHWPIVVPLLVLSVFVCLPHAQSAPPVGRVVDVSHRHVYGMRWRRSAIERGFERTIDRLVAHPVISDRYNLVIVAQGEGDVIAYRLRNGEEVWRKRTGVPWAEGVTLVRVSTDTQTVEAMLLSSRDGTLSLLRTRDGSEIWKVDIGTESRAPATLVRDRFLITTVDSGVMSLKTSNGETVWHKKRPKTSGLTIDGHSRPVYDRGVVYCAFADGHVGALRFDDGTELWMRPVSLYAGASAAHSRTVFGDADADPIIVGQTIFVASYADGVYALERSTGEAIWRREMSAVVSLGRYKNTIIALSANGFLRGLDRRSGAEVFSTSFPPAAPSRLRVVDHLGVFTAGRSGLIVVDLRKGQPLQATALGSPTTGDPGFSEDGRSVAVLTETGLLYTLVGGAPGLID